MGTTRGRRHEAERAEGYERAPELLAGNWYQQKPDQKTEGYRKPESPVSTMDALGVSSWRRHAAARYLLTRAARVEIGAQRCHYA